jgi:FkbM family methyltransferase
VKTNTKIFLAKAIYFFLSFLLKKKQYIIKRNNINWKLDLSEGIDLSLFLFGSFQKEIIHSMTKLIYKKNYKNSINIIDIGSNIGDKSLSLAQELLSNNIKKFKIYSVEPTDFAYRKQIANLRLNPNLKKKISVFKKFISTKKKLPKSTYSSWSLKSIDNRHKIHGGVLRDIDSRTEILTLDKFIKENQIKNQIILKIDVDGFEMEVLKSLINNIKKNNPIIFMEYAPYALEGHGTSIKFFHKFLKKNKYEVFDLNFKKLDVIKISQGSSVDIVLKKKN